MQKRFCLLCLIGLLFLYDKTYALVYTATNNCNPGTYSSGFTCLNCLTGTYQAAIGASSCLQCDKGTYQSIMGSTACLSCIAGTFQAFPGQSDCLACEIGTYQSKGQATMCETCPVNQSTFSPSTYSNAIPGGTVCSLCPKSYYLSAAQCKSCNEIPGFYCDGKGGPLQCSTLKQPNQYFFKTCDTSSDAIIRTCTVCKASHAYADKPCTNTSDAICASCTVCNPMQEYTFSECVETRDAICKPCDRQLGDIEIGGKCNPCPAGAFGPQCNLCLPGTFSPTSNSAQCTPCPIGLTSGAGASQCVLNITSSSCKKLGNCPSPPSGLLLAAYDLTSASIQAVAPTLTSGQFMVVTTSPAQLYVMGNGSSWLFAGAYAYASVIMDGKGVQAIFYPRVLQLCLDVYSEGYLLLEETGALRWISSMAEVKTLSSSINARSIASFTGKGPYQFLMIRLDDNVLLHLNVLDETSIPLVGIVDYQPLFPLSLSISASIFYVLDNGRLLALKENSPSSVLCGGGSTLFTPSSNTLACSTVSLGTSGAISHLEYEGELYLLFFVPTSWSGIAKIIIGNNDERILSMMLILTDIIPNDDIPLGLIKGPDSMHIAYRNPAQIFRIGFSGQCQCVPGFYCAKTIENDTLCLEPPLGQIAPAPWTSTPIACPLGSISISTTQCAPCPLNFTTARRGSWFCRSVCESDHFMNPQTGECVPDCNASLGLYHEMLLGQCLPCWLGSGSDGGQGCIPCPPGQYGVSPGICASCPIGKSTVMAGTTRCMPLSFAWCQDGGITCPPTTNQPWLIQNLSLTPSSGLLVWPNGTYVLSFYDFATSKIPLGYFLNPFPTIIWMDLNKGSTLFFGDSTMVTWEPKSHIYGIAVMQVQGYVPMVYASTMLSLEEGTPPCAEVYAISTFDRTVSRFMSQDLLKSPTILLSQCILQPLVLHVTASGILYAAVGSWLYARLIVGPNASPQGIFNEQPLLQVDKGVITFMTSVGDGHLFVGTSTGQIHSVPPSAIQIHGYKTQLVDVKSTIRGMGAAGRRVLFTTDTNELKEIIFNNVQGCMAGYVPTNVNTELAGICMQAGRGTYSGIACPKGTYGPEPASLYCLPCAPGSIAPSTNSPTCISCEDISSFSNAEGTACLTQCPASQTSTQRACMGCNPGYILQNGICIPCQPGTYSPSGATTCIACNVGETSPAGAQDCVKICSGENQCAYDGQTCISLTKHYEVLSQIKLAGIGKQILGLAADIEGGVFYTDGTQIQYYLDTCTSYNTNCNALIMDLLPSTKYTDYKFTSLAICNRIQISAVDQQPTCNVFRILYVGSLMRSNIYKLNVCLDMERKVNGTATRLFSTLTLVSGTTRSGFADGSFTKAIFNQPVDLELNSACNILYVSDFGNHRIRLLNFSNQQVSTLVGSGQACWKEGIAGLCSSPSTMGCDPTTDQCASLQYPLGIGLSEDETSLYIAGNLVNSLFVFRFTTKRLNNICSFTFNNMANGNIQTCNLNVQNSKGCMLYRPFDVAVFQGQLFVGVTQGITRIDADTWLCEQVAGQFFDLQTSGLKDGIMPLADVNTTLFTTSLVNMPFKMAVSEGTGVMYFADLLNGAVRRVLVKNTCICPIGTQLLPSAHSCYNPSSITIDSQVKPLLECPNGFYALSGDKTCFRSCTNAFEEASIPSQCLVLPTSPLQSVTYSQLLSRLSPPQNTMLADWYGQGNLDPGYLFPLTGSFRQGITTGHAPSSNGAFVSLTFDLKRKCWSDVESISSYTLRPQLILPGLWLAYGEPFMAQTSTQTCTFPSNFIGFERTPITPEEEALAARKPKRWQALRNAAVAGGSPYITQSTAFIILGTPDQSAPYTCSNSQGGPCFPLFNDISFKLTNSFQEKWTQDHVLRIQCYVGWPAHYYCPNGYYWTPPDPNKKTCSGTPSVATCLSCLAGTFSSSSLQYRQVLGGPYTCTQCAVGFYASGVGSTECLACPSNTYSSIIGSTQCTACAPGTYTNLRAARSPLQCLDCVRGTGNCTNCVPGEYQHLSGQKKCEVVPAGYYSISFQADAPTPCELGTYQPNEGSSSCLTCPQGFITDSISATACTQCQNTGYCSLSIGNRCANGCGLNQYYDYISHGCQKCPDGKLNGENPCATDPNVCWENPRKDLYIDPQTQSILKCPNGTEALDDKSGCVDCQARYYSDEMSGGCKLCEAGTYSTMEKSTACLLCAPGYSNSKGDQGCSVCKPGTFAYTNGSSLCSLCPAGFVAPEYGSTSCKACPLDMVAPAKGMSECNVTCNTSEGFYSVMGDSACRYCANGLAIDTECRTCGKGYYLLISNNIHTCQICDPGLVNLFDENATNSSQCLPCPSPTAYALTNAIQCIEADEGFIPNSTMTGQTPCLPGTYRNISQSQCTVCAPGSFAPSYGTKMCTLCAMGFYGVNSGLSECIQCAPGSISGFMGATKCTYCPAGTYTTNNQVCLPCAKNFYSNGGSTTCKACANGLHSAGGASVCEPCPSWTYWSESQKACVVCSPGTFMLKGASFYCKACDAGKFLPFSGSTTIKNCTPCAPGTVAVLGGSSACSNCSIPGTTANADGQTCDPCNAGTYNSDGGICQPCPRGTFTSSKGASICRVCAPGTYQSVPMGGTTCTLCPPGTISYGSQDHDCISCLNWGENVFTPNAGQTLCQSKKQSCNSFQYLNLSHDPTLDNTCVDCVPCAPGEWASIYNPIEKGFDVLPPNSTGAYLNQLCPGTTTTPLYRCLSTAPKPGEFLASTESVGASATTSSSSMLDPFAFTKCTDSKFDNLTVEWVVGFTFQACYISCKYGVNLQAISRLYLSIKNLLLYEENPTQNILLQPWLQYKEQICLPCPNNPCPLGLYRPDFGNGCGPPCGLPTNLCQLDNTGCIAHCTNKPANSGYIGGSSILGKNWCPWYCSLGYFLSDNRTTCLPCGSISALQLCNSSDYALLPIDQCLPWYTSRNLCRYCPPIPFTKLIGWDINTADCQYECIPGYYANINITTNGKQMVCIPCHDVWLNNWTICPIGTYLDERQCYDKGIRPSCKTCTLKEASFVSAGVLNQPGSCKASCSPGFHSVSNRTNMYANYDDLNSFPTVDDLRCIACSPQDTRSCNFTTACFPGYFRNMSVRDGQPNSCVQCKKSRQCPKGTFALPCTGANLTDAQCLPCPTSLLIHQQFVSYGLTQGRIISPDYCPRTCLNNHVQNQQNPLICEPCPTTTPCLLSGIQPPLCAFTYAYWNATPDKVWWDEAHAPPFIPYSTGIIQRAGICWACPIGTATLSDSNALCIPLPGYASANLPMPNGKLPIPSLPSDVYLAMQIPRLPTLQSKSNKGRRLYQFQITSSNSTTTNALIMASKQEEEISGAVPCPYGTYKSDAGDGLCNTCPEGSSTMSTKSVALSSCMCKYGYYLVAKRNGPCLPCPVDTFLNMTVSILTTVPPMCMSCPPNTSTLGAIGATSCACALGYVQIQGSCVLCKAGFYCPPCTDRDAQCIPSDQRACFTGATSLPGSYDITNCTCNSPGLVIANRPKDTTQLYCRTLPLGSTLVDGRIKCLPGWTSSPTNSETCSLCPPGTYATLASDGQSLLLRSVTNTPICIPCPANTYNPTTSAIGECSSCPNQQISPKGSISLANCSCPSSQISVPGGCQGCLPNQYSANNGCNNCPLNSLAQAGASSVKDCLCKPGYALTLLNSTALCEPCKKGFYSTHASNTPCIPCPKGSTTAEMGSTRLSSCGETSSLCLPSYTWRMGVGCFLMR